MNKPNFTTTVPSHMFKGPHMVHLNGVFVHPGRDNDYTLFHSDSDLESVIIYWWNPSVRPKDVVSVLRLDTGERWGHSAIEGVFVDTRKV